MSDAAPASSCSYLDFKGNLRSYASAVMCKPAPAPPVRATALSSKKSTFPW